WWKRRTRSRTALERRRQRMPVGQRDGWSASPGLPAAGVYGRKEDRTAFASAPPLRFSRGDASGRRCDVSPLALAGWGGWGWAGAIDRPGDEALAPPARKGDIGEPALFVAVAIARGDDTGLEGGQED